MAPLGLKVNSSKKIVGLLFFLLIIMFLVVNNNLVPVHRSISRGKTLLLSAPFQETEPEGDSQSSCKSLQSKLMAGYKGFLYLIQTESCVPPPLMDPSVLGNPAACQCDLLVLSFKRNCKLTNSSMPHVTYIFNTSTTWTTGRSFLYTAAMRLKQKYVYYIIMDDDVNLQWWGRHVHVGQATPWRKFESLLLTVQPPVAAVDQSEWRLLERTMNRRQMMNCTLNIDDEEYIPAVWFDAMFNAFHYEAFQAIFGPILPYWSRYDRTSWWWSEWYVNIMSDILYHGQVLHSSVIMASNTVHRAYPRRMHNSAVLQAVTNDITKLIPEQYLKVSQPLLTRFVTKYSEILETVEETYCLPPPPPCREVEPFSWVTTSQSESNAG